MNNNNGNIILYQTDDGKITVNVRFEDETFWLTQKAIAELFDTTVANINIHIKNIFDEEELSAEATIKDFLIVQAEGVQQDKAYISEFDRDMAKYFKGENGGEVDG